MTFFANKKFAAVFAVLFFGAAAAFADVDPSVPEESSEPLKQFPAAEIVPLPQIQPQVRTPVISGPDQAVSSPTPEQPSIDFPKVKTLEDERLATQFSWWPTDAKPAPVKDSDRSGYWWWPEVPGQMRPWGNQGFIYVRKIIFDYKSTVGEMKPSLIIKKILKNVKVYFDFDKSDLRDDTRELLSKATVTLDKNPQTDLLVTGNADVRGSEKYNLKLGESRAASVRQFILDQGIAEGRIRILSRGKMDALAPTNDIVGMQKDRNAQFMIAEVEEVMIPAEKAALFQDKIMEEKQEIESAVRVDTKDYVIQPNDTLWAIAKREYGDGNQWKRIYEFNRDAISDPNRPRKGTRIKIPIE